MIGDHSEMKIAGTPHYMCPELIYKKNYDPFKADIWAFGILLYWITLGYFPQDNLQKKKRNEKIFSLKFPVDIHPGI
jgi:serine/threonine protein kinase